MPQVTATIHVSIPPADAFAVCEYPDIVAAATP